jgi:hypothetical protein
MNEFLQLGLTEYRKYRAAHIAFQLNTHRISKLFGFDDEPDVSTSLLILTPLYEIGWADGKIGHHEQDVILEAASR